MTTDDDKRDLPRPNRFIDGITDGVEWTYTHRVRALYDECEKLRAEQPPAPPKFVPYEPQVEEPKAKPEDTPYERVLGALERVLTALGLHPDTPIEAALVHIDSVRREARDSADAFSRGVVKGHQDAFAEKFPVSSKAEPQRTDQRPVLHCLTPTLRDLFRWANEARGTQSFVHRANDVAMALAQIEIERGGK